MTKLTNIELDQILIEVAKSQGTHHIIPNDNQLKRWTIVQILSGDECILQKTEKLINEYKASKNFPVKIKFVIWWNFENPEIVNTFARLVKKDKGHYEIYFPDGSYDKDCVFDVSKRFFVGCL